MLLSEFLARQEEQGDKEGNPHIQCNAFYKTGKTINCYLTPSQAVEFARHLLSKAQLILDNNIEDSVVQIWNKGEANERLYFGLTKARKGPRRKKSL